MPGRRDSGQGHPIMHQPEASWEADGWAGSECSLWLMVDSKLNSEQIRKGLHRRSNSALAGKGGGGRVRADSWREGTGRPSRFIFVG